MEFLIRCILGHRRVTLIGVAAVTLVALSILTQARLSSSLGDMLFSGMPEYERSLEWSRQLGSDFSLLISVPESDIRSSRFQKLVRELSELEGVRKVLSQVDLPAASGLPAMVSPTGHALVDIECEASGATSLEKAPRFLSQVREICQRNNYAEDEIHFSGLVAVLAAVQEETRHALLVLAPSCALVLLLMTWVLLRRIQPVLLTMTAGLVSVVWMAGFAIGIDRDVNILLAAAPALMFLIAFADVAHIYCAYDRCRKTGEPHHDAVRQSAIEVGRACVFTSATTWVGFAGLLFIDVATIQRFGFVMGFGVAVALLLALVITPIMLRDSPFRADARFSQLDHLAEALAAVAIRFPKFVIGVFTVLFAVAVVGLMQLSIETDMAARLSEESRLHRDMQFIESQFDRLGTVELLVEWSEEVTSSEIAVRSKELVGRLQQHKDVLQVISLVSLLDQLPPEAWNHKLARAFVDPDRRRARLVLMTGDTGMTHARHLGQYALQQATNALGKDVQVYPGGTMFLGGLWLERHVESQPRALLITFLLIAIVIAICFQSWRVGVMAMIPNLFPLLMLGGCLGFFYGAVDSDMVVVAFIAIGLAVDDTIHILSRYRFHCRAGKSLHEAVQLTMQDAGRSVVVTSLVFATAALPFVFSDYTTIQGIGIFLPVTMLAAVAADIVLLPAMICLGWFPGVSDTRPPH